MKDSWSTELRITRCARGLGRQGILECQRRQALHEEGLDCLEGVYCDHPYYDSLSYREEELAQPGYSGSHRSLRYSRCDPSRHTRHS